MTGLLAVQAIDVAIFGSLGGLWVLGAVFIVLLYRWILRYERSSMTTPTAATPLARTPSPSPALHLPSEAVAIAS